MSKLTHIRRQWKRKIANIKTEIKRYRPDLLGFRKNQANHWSDDMFLKLEAMKKQMSDDLQEEVWLMGERDRNTITELQLKTAQAAAEAIRRGIDSDVAAGLVSAASAAAVQESKMSVLLGLSRRLVDAKQADTGTGPALKIPACYYTIEWSARSWDEKRLNADRPWVKKPFEQLTWEEKLTIWSLRNRHGIEVSQFNKAELAVLDEVDA